MPRRYTDESLPDRLRDFLQDHGIQLRDGADVDIALGDVRNERPNCSVCFEPDPQVDQPIYGETPNYTARTNTANWSFTPPTPPEATRGPLRPGSYVWRRANGIRIRSSPWSQEFYDRCLNEECRNHYITDEEFRQQRQWQGEEEERLEQERQAFIEGDFMDANAEEEEIPFAPPRRRLGDDAGRLRDRYGRFQPRADPWARNVKYSADHKAKRLTRPYGVEIEASFDDMPFDAAYSSPPPMPNAYYGGWLAKTDSSIRSEGGIEAVSPVFRGAGSLAEVISTATMLEDAGGEANRYCGLHVTLSTQDPEEQLDVMRFFTLLEEAAFAVSGDYERWYASRYSRPMKTPGYYEEIRRGMYFREKYAAIHSKPGCTEFRYPSGTLDPVQIVLNVGLPQLIIRLAAGLGPNTINKMMEQGVNMQSIYIDREAKARLFTLYGLKLLYAQGWRKGGEFWGVAYNPRNPPTYTVKDEAREHEDVITLPDSDELFTRYAGNVGAWSGRLGIEEDAMSIVNGEYNSTVDETLEVLTNGESLVLPSAGSLKALASYE